MKQSNVPHGKSREQSTSHREESASDEPVGVLLFEMVTPSTNRLVIPFVLAETHFPPLATRKRNEKQYEILKFTDFHHHKWDMKVEYYSDERGFILSGWQKFSTQYNLLKPMDLIRIYEPFPSGDPLHFLIKVEKKEQRIDPKPEFKDENFLFQIKLDQSNINFSRVFLAGDDVMRNFPAVEMQRNSGEKTIIMRFTDAKCKDWYMNIIKYNEKNYMLMEGWDEFVKERGLEAGDLILFYKHVDPCHSKHFLIRIAKKRGTGGPRTGQPGGGSGAGSSSQSYKGKEIAGGD